MTLLPSSNSIFTLAAMALSELSARARGVDVGWPQEHQLHRPESLWVCQVQTDCCGGQIVRVLLLRRLAPCGRCCAVLVCCACTQPTLYIPTAETRVVVLCAAWHTLCHHTHTAVVWSRVHTAAVLRGVLAGMLQATVQGSGGPAAGMRWGLRT